MTDNNPASKVQFDPVVSGDSRLRAILEGLFTFVGVFSLDGVVVDVNRAPLAASGLQIGDVVGRRFIDLPWWSHAPEERARIAEAISRAGRGEPARFETNVRRVAGGIMYVDAAFAPLHDAAGVVTHVLGSGVDVTARRRVEEALAASEARLAEAQRVAHVGSWAWDVASNAVTWSDELYAVYGIAKGAFGGTYEAFLACVHPDDVELTKNVVRRGLESATPFVYDHRVVRSDGAVRRLHTRGQMVADANGRPLRLVGSCWDITEQWQAEESLRASRLQLRALAARLDAIREEERRLLSREIHDRLGQDLTALKLDLAWLRARLPADADPERARRVARMEELLDGTLETARRVSAELRPVLLEDLGLADAIDWQARDFEARTGIGCAVSIARDGLPAIEPGAALALFRILQEAMTNVARHAGARRVSIGLALEESGSELVLTIEDDGRGITGEEQGRHTSLGLLGMRERALVVGGTVSFGNRAAGGTIVTARLPRTPEAA